MVEIGTPPPPPESAQGPQIGGPHPNLFPVCILDPDGTTVAVLSRQGGKGVAQIQLEFARDVAQAKVIAYNKLLKMVEKNKDGRVGRKGRRGRGEGAEGVVEEASEE